MTGKTAELAQKILDAKLQLIRLRKAHPQPRLTVKSASAQADNQVLELQKLDDTLAQLKQNIERVGIKVKDGAKEVERLRVQRAEVEKQAKVAQSEIEDGRMIGLYDWYADDPSLDVHRELMIPPEPGSKRH